MQTQKGPLKKALDGATTLAILGIGSDLRADDNVGMYIASKLNDILKVDLKVKVFLGGVAPENFSGEIKKFKPSHLLMIDCGNIGGAPGDSRLVFPEEEMFGAVFSTHKLPIKVLVNYLKTSIDVNAFMLLVQPKSIEFGGQMSGEVIAAADALIDEISRVLNNR